MKKDNKKATKDRKKVAVKDLKPKAASQIKGGSSIQSTAEISVKGSNPPPGGTPKEIIISG